VTSSRRGWDFLAIQEYAMRIGNIPARKPATIKLIATRRRSPGLAGLTDAGSGFAGCQVPVDPGHRRARQRRPAPPLSIP
jgi:hypothetical protein